MCGLTQPNSAIHKTVDLRDTLLFDQRVPVKALNLLVHSAPEPAASQSLLVGQVMTVGRTSDADIKVARDNRVSRMHFSIECCDDRAIVRDLESTNGTYVNGKSTSKSVVYDGDQIVAGATVFTVRLVTDMNQPPRSE